MGDFVKVAGVSEIPPGEMKIVDLGGQDVVIANVNGSFFAFGNDCSHRQGPLGEGMLMDTNVECPFHGGQFDVRTGEAVAAPPTESVPTFAVRVEGEDIEVEKP